METQIETQNAEVQTGPVGISYTTWRYHNDPQFREAWLKRCVESRRKAFQQDPERYAEYKRKANERSKERYQNDPEYREKRKQNAIRCKQARKNAEALTPIPSPENLKPT